MICAERETAHKIDRVDQMRCLEENRDEERRGEGTREPDRAYREKRIVLIKTHNWSNAITSRP